MRWLLAVLLLSLGLWHSGMPQIETQAASALADSPLAEQLRDDKLHAPVDLQQRIAFPTRPQMRRFTEALRVLRTYRDHADPRLLDKARGLLRSVNYQLVAGTDGYWYLRDRLPARRWGAYALSRAPRDRLLVAVPGPTDEAHALEAGLAVFYESGAQALAIAGAAGPDDRAASVSRNTFFHAFHRIYAYEDVVAVRGVALDVARWRAWMPLGASRLWVHRRSPASVELDRLKTLVGTLVVIGKAASDANLQRDATPRTYAELQLNRDDAARLVAALETRATMPAPWRTHVVKAPLEDWLKIDVALDGVPMARPSGFEREVLEPLVRIAGAGYAQGRWSRGGDAQLRALHYLAAGSGYGITRLREPRGRQEYVLLHPVRPQAGHAWYVLRAGGGDDYVVTVPAAAREPHALEYALSVFRALGARALANDTDMQVLASMRRTHGHDPDEQAFMTVISRALPSGVASASDVSLAFADGTMSRDSATPLADRLVSVVKGTGRSYHFVSAMADAPASATSRSEIATLWLSPQSKAHAGAVPYAVAAAVHRRPLGAAKSAAAPSRALQPARLAGIDAPERIGPVH